MCADKMQNLNEDDEKSSHFIFETAEDGNKTNAETTDTSGYKIEAKDLPDSWDSHAGNQQTLYQKHLRRRGL